MMKCDRFLRTLCLARKPLAMAAGMALLGLPTAAEPAKANATKPVAAAGAPTKAEVAKLLTDADRLGPEVGPLAHALVDRFLDDVARR